ncbi:MAG: PASTA domain-containing protein [Ruminococcaceae bacterium]|nr:PASTA domain-containing protein [Oscillospiraceae bacterium]
MQPPVRPTDTGTIKRAGFIGVLFASVFLLLLFRILKYQTIDYDKYRNKVLNQITTEAEVVAERGKIYDRNGVLLATSTTTYRVFIAPRIVAQVSEEQKLKYDVLIATELAPVLDVDYEYILKQTTYTKYMDRTLARNVDEEVAKQVRKIIKDNDLEDMVFLQAGTKRYYPNGTLACHALGFTGSDGAGQYGLELKYDSILAGTNGKYITARDSHGNEMPYEYQSYIEAQDGYSIVTTLDINVQAALEEQLRTAYIESGGKNRATGIVVDVETGEVLAMATYPVFDLNDPRKMNEADQLILDQSGFAPDSEEYRKLQQELQLATWSNKAVTEVYMPGSTFKIVTASMAYEENLVVDSERFYCPGYHVVLGIKMRCHKTEGHGSQTFATGLQNSCNPVLMMMGARVGREKFYNYFRSFGYLEKTGIDLPGEGTSIFYPETAFSELDLATASFGQNFKISPIQQVMAVTTVANGGYLMTPRMVKEVLDSEGNVIKTYSADQKRQVISTATSKKLAAVLEEGVSGGAGAKNAYVAGYRVAAKTGTSEKIDKKNETGKEYYVCSCVGFAPADDPEIAVIFLVDEPTKGVLYGSTVAAPYLANIMRDVLPYLGVEAVYTDKELANLAVKTPSLVGYYDTIAEAEAELRGFEVEIVGSGSMVRAQSPAPGTVVESQNAKIILYTDREPERAYVTVPDLSGRTAVSANEILANNGLNIRIAGTNNYMSGSGAVAISQSHAAGTQVERGTVITVTFRNQDADDIPLEQ